MINKIFYNTKNFSYSLMIFGAGLFVAGLSVVTIPGYKMLDFAGTDWHVVGFGIGIGWMTLVVAFWLGVNYHKNTIKE